MEVELMDAIGPSAGPYLIQSVFKPSSMFIELNFSRVVAMITTRFVTYYSHHP
jgi:hypothetical protein